MAITHIKDCMLTLAWIQSGENMPGYYRVVMKLRDVSTSNISYISFPFSSFDLMNLYLKLLARTYRLCAIDSLMKGEYPVKVEYEEPFNAPYVFKTLYTSDEKIWPGANMTGYFMIDVCD